MDSDAQRVIRPPCNESLQASDLIAMHRSTTVQVFLVERLEGFACHGVPMLGRAP